MTRASLSCANCLAPMAAEQALDDIGLRSTGYCPACGFLTVVHSFADLRRPDDGADEAPKGVSSRTWRGDVESVVVSFPDEEARP